MGWVVYDTVTGDLIRYYKKAGSARAQVTRHNKELAAGSYWMRSYRERACCSYRDYEGVLMGLRDEQLKMWQFCNTERTT
jgi:hypothetical protein